MVRPRPCWQIVSVREELGQPHPRVSAPLSPKHWEEAGVHTQREADGGNLCTNMCRGSTGKCIWTHIYYGLGGTSTKWGEAGESICSDMTLSSPSRRTGTCWRLPAPLSGPRPGRGWSAPRRLQHSSAFVETPSFLFVSPSLKLLILNIQFWNRYSKNLINMH